MTEQQTDRLKQIRERLDSAEAKDRPNSGPFRATPERGPDNYRHAEIWGPDGDQLGTAYGNLALGIDGDALAEMWAHAPDDVAWLLGEVERLWGVKDNYHDVVLLHNTLLTERDALRLTLDHIVGTVSNGQDGIDRDNVHAIVEGLQDAFDAHTAALARVEALAESWQNCGAGTTAVALRAALKGSE